MQQTTLQPAMPATPTPAVRQRLWEVDTFRGITVMLMIYFHFMWDLFSYGVVEVNVYSAPWQIFARCIGTTFTFLLGLSVTLTAARQSSYAALLRYALRRGAAIFGFGMLISVVTFVAFGDEYVRFGILHLLGTALVLAALFVPLPASVSLATGVVAIVVGAYLNTLVAPFPWLNWLGVVQAGVAMVDYYPLLPWGGAALIGVAVGKWAYPAGRRRISLPDLGAVPPVRGLRFLGRNSLLIYLVHQPLLIGITLVLAGLR